MTNQKQNGAVTTKAETLPAAKITNNNFKVLKWDRESAIYIPITIEL